MGHNNSQNSDRPPAEPTGNGHYNRNRYGPRGSGRGNTGQTLINTEEDREDVTNSGLHEMGWSLEIRDKRQRPEERRRW